MGIRLGDFEPGKGFRSGWRGAIGIGTAFFAPAAAYRRVLGIRLTGFEPGKAYRRVLGIKLAVFEPAKACGGRV